ncbi:hypothetical protein MPNT_20203 [Candidatus Methylacidithermus pantelleriae]|uniref:Uncharacterized protein n=1 Tax=Candidatus Methylacidithermus pantelleriae TaxID=2744239 RepID=A0A8J2BT17_9BACT|nr:hypothetical protein MPNT_20203 [Candidatus Methylacidithermus pantelleriae]
MPSAAWDEAAAPASLDVRVYGVGARLQKAQYDRRANKVGSPLAIRRDLVFCNTWNPFCFFPVVPPSCGSFSGRSFDRQPSPTSPTVGKEIL